jgi:murein L,D-transpeptidase YafK
LVSIIVYNLIVLKEAINVTLNRKLQILLLLVVGIVSLTRFSSENLKAASSTIKRSIQSISENGSDKSSIITDVNKTNEQPIAISTAPAVKVSALQPKVVADNNKSLADILAENGIKDLDPDAKILIDKSDHTLSIVNAGVSLKTYHVEFGDGGMGDKEIEGDHKTPEGTFYVTDKEIMDPADEYLGTRWLGVSYPETEDAQRGIDAGLIDNQTYNDILNALNNYSNPPQDTALGGNIGIHGGGGPTSGSNWTFGCVGLKNSDIEEFYDYINVGTPIVIQK